MYMHGRGCSNFQSSNTKVLKFLYSDFYISRVVFNQLPHVVEMFYKVGLKWEPHRKQAWINYKKASFPLVVPFLGKQVIILLNKMADAVSEEGSLKLSWFKFK